LNVAGPSIRYVTAFPVRNVVFDDIAPEMIDDQRVGSSAALPDASLDEESLEDESFDEPFVDESLEESLADESLDDASSDDKPIIFLAQRD